VRPLVLVRAILQIYRQNDRTAVIRDPYICGWSRDTLVLVHLLANTKTCGHPGFTKTRDRRPPLEVSKIVEYLTYMSSVNIEAEAGSDGLHAIGMDGEDTRLTLRRSRRGIAQPRALKRHPICVQAFI